jgi:hypothetical protein
MRRGHLIANSLIWPPTPSDPRGGTPTLGIADSDMPVIAQQLRPPTIPTSLHVHDGQGRLPGRVADSMEPPEVADARFCMPPFPELEEAKPASGLRP